MGFVVREAGARDVPVIVDIINDGATVWEPVLAQAPGCWDPFVTEGLICKAMAKRVYLIGEMNGEPAAVCAYMICGRVAALMHFYVRRAYHKRGLGSRLYAEVERRLRDAGCSSVYLATNWRASWATSFYNFTGAFPPELDPDELEYCPGEDVIMVKGLVAGCPEG